jgi:ubiquinone/menaquinone biosynthesis C-methylase UbiE
MVLVVAFIGASSAVILSHTDHMDRLLEATARAERDHFWFHGFRRFVAPLLARATRGRRDAAILDCGCGTGNNLEMLRRYGRAVGIDITWSGLAYARQRGERQVARASATSLPFPTGHFDLVTSFDVLYAFDDDLERQALNEMYRVLRPGGQVLINTAALKSLRGNHSVLGGEVRRYDRRELRDHLTRTGFTVLRITYTNFTILPIVAGVRWSQRLTGHRESTSEMTVPSAPVNLTLSALLAVEAAAARYVNMPVGSSLLALAQKP